MRLPVPFEPSESSEPEPGVPPAPSEPPSTLHILGTPPTNFVTSFEKTSRPPLPLILTQYNQLIGAVTPILRSITVWSGINPEATVSCLSPIILLSGGCTSKTMPSFHSCVN